MSNAQDYCKAKTCDHIKVHCSIPADWTYALTVNVMLMPELLKADSHMIELFDRSFLMHDVFQEMQLNGQTAEPGAFMKACVGSASEYGGARPWESRLFYDAMQRSGAQMNVSHYHDISKAIMAPVISFTFIQALLRRCVCHIKVGFILWL